MTDQNQNQKQDQQKKTIDALQLMWLATEGVQLLEEYKYLCKIFMEDLDDPTLSDEVKAYLGSVTQRIQNYIAGAKD